jgi:hypothetical protein
MSAVTTDQSEIADAYMQHVPELRHCHAQNLWAICCDRSADFWLRQGAFIVLKERGFDMPELLPIDGDLLPNRRVDLRVVQV